MAAANGFLVPCAKLSASSRLRPARPPAAATTPNIPLLDFQMIGKASFLLSSIHAVMYFLLFRCICDSKTKRPMAVSFQPRLRTDLWTCLPTNINRIFWIGIEVYAKVFEKCSRSLCLAATDLPLRANTTVSNYTVISIRVSD